MEIKELSNAEFNSFTDSFPYFSIYQTSEYGFIMNTQNYESLFLGLIDENKILAATLLLVEKKSMFKYAYAPKGFLIDYNNKELVENFTNLIKEYLGKKKIIAVKINPMIIKSSYDYKTNMAHINPKFEEQLEFLKSIGYYHLGFNNLFESFKPRYDAIIDLNKPLNRLFNNINIKFKKKVKSADLSGVRIVKASDKDIDYIYDQVKDKYPRDKKYFEDVFFFFKKRNLIDYYYAKLDTNAYLIYIQKKYQKQMNICNKINSKLFKRTGKNNNKIINNKINEEKYLNELKNELVYATNLLKEKPEGVILATMIITKYRNEAYILIDGFNKEFKKINAKHLMTWKLIEKYSKEKFSRFNLGGMTNPNIKSEKYNGLNEFKLSFNARCVEYIGDLELVTNNALYAIYKNSKPIRYILKKDK
ncbi:MAG: peptidoglycan bridge formation glycyltransferase FemA/FemB family protein [bacterium]|nr:peptidoglycan bridge formation glycyltransferase FemA/FemB family protein [bacterium]